MYSKYRIKVVSRGIFILFLKKTTALQKSVFFSGISCICSIHV